MYRDSTKDKSAVIIVKDEVSAKEGNTESLAHTNVGM